MFITCHHCSSNNSIVIKFDNTVLFYTTSTVSECSGRLRILLIIYIVVFTGLNICKDF